MLVWTSTPALSFQAPWTQNLDSRPLTSFLSGPPSRRPAHLPIRKVLFGVGQTNRLGHLCLKRKQQLSHLGANHPPKKGQAQDHLKAISSEQGPLPTRALKLQNNPRLWQHMFWKGPNAPTQLCHHSLKTATGSDKQMCVAVFQ